MIVSNISDCPPGLFSNLNGTCSGFGSFGFDIPDGVLPPLVRRTLERISSEPLALAEQLLAPALFPDRGPAMLPKQVPMLTERRADGPYLFKVR